MKDATSKRDPANEALKASEINYHRLFESAGDGVVILDAITGLIVDINPYLIDLLSRASTGLECGKLVRG